MEGRGGGGHVGAEPVDQYRPSQAEEGGMKRKEAYLTAASGGAGGSFIMIDVLADVV